METDNPRRLTITMDFPAAGNTPVNELARMPLKQVAEEVREEADLRDFVFAAGTLLEARIRVEHTNLEQDGEGNLIPSSD